MYEETLSKVHVLYASHVHGITGEGLKFPQRHAGFFKQEHCHALPSGGDFENSRRLESPVCCRGDGGVGHEVASSWSAEATCQQQDPISF